MLVLEELCKSERFIVYENGTAPLGKVDLEIKPMLSVVLPAYNEAETIRGVVLDYFDEIVNKLPSRLVVAEDGSRDRTPEILSSLAKEVPMSVFSYRIGRVMQRVWVMR